MGSNRAVSELGTRPSKEQAGRETNGAPGLFASATIRLEEPFSPPLMKMNLESLTHVGSL